MVNIYRKFYFVLIFLGVLVSCSGPKTQQISFIETTDVHGVILPYDYIEKKELNGSLASVLTYVKKERTEKDAVVLLDNGDNLQGQPAVYYYNFADTVSPHLLAEAMNFMAYDAGTVGNHDIETGHAVYDRLRRLYNFPLLAANVVDVKTGNPYFKPYEIINRNGIRIAILGLVTQTINNTLPRELYKGMEIRDMFETAQKWMPLIKKEKPDLIIGLFHSGWENPDSDIKNPASHEDEGAAASIAMNIPGFDIIFTGHDHKVANDRIVNSAGDTVLILNGGSRAMNMAQADVILYKEKRRGGHRKVIKGKILKVSDYKPDTEFMEKFKKNHETILAYVDEVIGNSLRSVSSRDSYFGPSGFVDMIHSLQLEMTGADISFAAPLSFDVEISKGPVTISDMFKLYRFENMLYTMRLSGEEILKYLEFSYSGWYNTMKSPDDLLLKFRIDKKGKIVLNDGQAWLRNPAYNFDSAAGIEYTVDVSKPEGSRVDIKKFTNGTPFDRNRSYNVAVNSYRGNGGGGHLTEGAGLTRDEMLARVITSTDRDLRYYMIESIKKKKNIDPEPLNNWKLIPEKLVKAEAAREYKMLFGNKK